MMKTQIQLSENFRRFYFLAAIFCFGALTAFGAPRFLSSHRPAVIARLAPVGYLSPMTNLNLAIGLDLRNKDELNQFLEQLYDPTSPDYGHYLTKEQFVERFAPSAADYKKAIAYANAHGLTVTRRYANRMLFDVTGSVTNIEKIFHVQMRIYRDPMKNRNFHAPDRVPSVDPEFPILDASGLDNFGRRRMDGGTSQKTENLSGSGPGGLVISSDLRAAYAPGVTLNGAGQTIAILSWGQVFPNDIAQFERVNGLPDVNVQAVPVNGFSTTPPEGFSDDAEWALDVQMAMSMAPGATILVYEGNNIDDILNKIADDDIAKQVSTSGGYYPASAMLPNIVSEFSAQGQSFYAASGDNGAYTNAIFETTNILIYQPTTYPNMTAVGGTVMTLAQHGGPWVSETAWNGSGGGWDPDVAIPSYQQGISMTANHGSTQYRNVPDISMQAVNLYSIRNNGVLVPTSGTSASAPLMAGFTALVNQQAAANGRPPVGTINAAIYNIGQSAQAAAAFHDITSGNNTNSRSPNDFSAVSGYDLCTGWGAPNGTNLINLLAAPTDPLHIAPGFGFAATILYGGDVSAASTTFTLTNTGSSDILWLAGSSAPWLHVFSTGNNLTPGNSMQMTTELNTSQAEQLSVGTHYAQVMFTNTTTGVVQTRFFTLTVSAAAQPLSLTGFNASLVVPADGTSGQPKATAFDTPAGYCFYQAGLSGGARGLPATGRFVSGWDGRTVFQLGTYGANDALILGKNYANSGTLTLSSPQSLDSLVVLASSVDYSGKATTGTVTINFTNGAHSQTFNFYCPNWFGTSSNCALAGVGRINLNNFSTQDNGNANPAFYQTTLPLAAMGLTQAIASITFTMPNEATNTAIFAISGVSGALDVLQPTITQQPQSVAKTDSSDGVSFNVTVAGAPPFSYQWYSNNVPLPYGILPTLTIPPNIFRAITDYQVVVSNLYGAVTSSVATLSLSDVTQPLAVSGFNASVIVPATGTSSQPDATAFDTQDDYAFYEAGLSGSSRGLPATGQFTSSWDGQTVFQFGAYGADDALMLGRNYANSGTLTLVTPHSFHSLAILASSADYSGQATVGTMVINFTNGTHSQSFNFNAPNWFSSYSYVALAGVGRINLGGFSIADDGDTSPAFYQTTIPLAALGLTQAVASVTFTMPPQAANTAIFAVSETVGAVDPPAIVQQPSPASELLFIGDTLSLTASAVGSSPLSYLWKFNGVPIPGATNANYVLPDAQTTDSGAYSLTVSNAFGTVTSTMTTVAVMPSTPYPVNVLALNPLAYWRLNETGGTTAFDFAGANNGVYTNVILGRPGYGSTAPVQSDPTELAAQFGPTNSYVSIPTIDLSVPNGGNGEFAIAAWVNASNTISTDAGIVTKGYGGGDEQFNLDCGGVNHAFRFFVRDAATGNAYSATSSVQPDNQWHWLMGVCDEANSKIILYIDGTNAAEGTIPAGSGIHASTVPASIGAREGGLGQPYNLQFLGEIDDVAIFTNALDASQITSIYQAVTAIGIQQEPTATIAVVVGGSVANQVIATGSGLSYQWFGPGGTIPGATNAMLTLTNVQPAQGGTYYVTVSSSFGTVQSTTSLLRVEPAIMYSQDFSSIAGGATNLGDSSELFSTALGTVANVVGMTDNQPGELALTANDSPNVSSAFLLPDLNPGSAVQAFSVKWNSQVYGNFPNAGAGFSFNFGQLAGLNLTNGAVESGYGTGLCFSVQTFGSNPGFYLRLNGNVIAAVTNDPTAQWGNYNDARHYWEIDWHSLEGLTVRLDGVAIFYRVPTTGFVPQAGDRMAWAARTTDYGEEMRLGNIAAVTGGNLVRIAGGNPIFEGTGDDLWAGYAFDNNLSTFWENASSALGGGGFLGATVQPAEVVAYSLTMPSSTHPPRSWTLVGSTNGGTSWSNIADASGNFVNGSETRAWLANNLNSFNAYGLNKVVPPPVRVAELKFYKFEPFTTNLPGNIISSSDPINATLLDPNIFPEDSPTGQGAPQAIDGTAATKYLHWAITNAGFTVFPSIFNLNRPVCAISLISAEDMPARDPASFMLFGSHDGANFTLIASNAVPLFVSTNSIQSISFANTNIYAAYKIIFPTVQGGDAADAMQIAEVEMLPYGDITSPDDALNLQLPADASLNGIGSANSLLNRMVGGDADKIVVLNDTTNVVAFITPAAGTSIVKGIELIGGNDDALYPEREPSSVTLEGSNDGNNFVLLASATPQTPTANLQIQGFSVLGNTNAYKTYRVTFGPPQSGNILQVGELRLFGVTSVKLNTAVSNGNLSLSWPSSDFVLEQSTNLASPNWTPVTNAVTVTNGESRVKIAPSDGGRFFRLGGQ